MRPDRHLETAHVGMRTEKALSEQELILFQHLLLTPGLHSLPVLDMRSSRTTLFNMMQSLNYYQAPAYLGLDHDNLHPTVTDICLQLLNNGFFDSPTQLNLEMYLFESFENDFLWIEETANLQNSSWYNLFKHTIMDVLLEDIPVILLQTECCR